MKPADVAAICKRHGVEPDAIRDLNRHREREPWEARREVLVAALAEGMTVPAIAALIGAERNAVRMAIYHLRRGESYRARPVPPPKPEPPPPPPRVGLGLVEDPHPERLYQRRNGDCVRLTRCELEWIGAHGNEQAACPTTCGGYRKRVA